MKRAWLVAFLVPSLAAAQAPPTKRPEKPHDMSAMQHDMASMKHDSGMAMPIPMPKGMPMIPGLVGLTPPVTSFLPAAGVDPMRLPTAKPSVVTRLRDGDTLDLTATFVRRTIKGQTFAMYGFNEQVPGPLIRVPQNATITVRFRNRIDLPSSVHWHGVRLENRNDGVPGVTQQEIAPGGTFVYRVHFPDAGIYWYHPHVREDIEQAMGLVGNMLVDSPDPDYYAPVNREQTLMLDDLLVHGDSLIPFGKEGPTFAMMGRVGNVLLVNGEPSYTLAARKGEVVRFFITNASSSRTYNLSFGPDVALKVVASDVSRFEREERVPSVVLAPAERYVVEARFDKPGRYALVSSVQAINHFKGEFEAEVDTLGIVTVGATAATPDYGKQFATLRRNAAVSKDIDKYRPYFDKAPEKTLTLTLRTSALPLATVQFMNVDTAYFAPVEWVDGMPDMNWLSTSEQVRWVLRDETGKENMDIAWTAKRGDIVKLRIFNDPKSFHPMQHPIHLHGQRMLVVARDGVRMRNLVWKDTALIPVGSTVDLLIDASNPGRWMLHCHIAEHLGSGMMAVFDVQN